MEEEKKSRGMEKERDAGEDGTAVDKAQWARQGRWLPQPLVSQCSDSGMS